VRIEQTFIVARPPEAVFDYLTDPSKVAEWQTAKTSVESLTDGPPRLGSRMRERTRPPGAMRLLGPLATRLIARQFLSRGERDRIAFPRAVFHLTSTAGGFDHERAAVLERSRGECRVDRRGVVTRE
jgi:hypothetical protein